MKAPAKPQPVATVIDRRVARHEAQVETLIEAVELLAHGLAGGPVTEPGGGKPGDAARRAHELLLLAKSGAGTA